MKGKSMFPFRKYRDPRKARRSVSISRIMALTFLGIIALGTLLLSVPAALADDLCDMAYIARFRDKKEIDAFFAFVCER